MKTYTDPTAANINSAAARLDRQTPHHARQQVDADWRMDALERAGELALAGRWQESREQAAQARDYAEYVSAARALGGGR